MNFFSKLVFLWKRPKIIIITGNSRALAAEAISQVLKQKFSIRTINGKSSGFFNPSMHSGLTPSGSRSVKEKVFIFETKLERARSFNFFVKNSKLPILVVTNIGEIPPDKNVFTGEKKETEEIKKLAEILPPFVHLVLNFDDEAAREIKDEIKALTLTYGSQKGADLSFSDLHFNKGINFKINYKGNIVPFWLDSLYGKEQIYSALAATACGIIFDLNLVEISQALKSYKSLPGKIGGGLTKVLENNKI